jgi:uncharacterized short protein YbdD (DUF466 family)
VLDEIGKAGKFVSQTLRLMVGVPDYPTYVAHIKVTHPGLAPMSYEEFFVERLNARYGAKGRASCC